jgi:hypothetical protein
MKCRLAEKLGWQTAQRTRCCSGNGEGGNEMEVTLRMVWCSGMSLAFCTYPSL